MARPWIEVAVVLAAGLVPGLPTPLLAMLIAASVLRWLSGDSSADQASNGRWIAELAIGAVFGGVAFSVVSLAAGISTVGELTMVRAGGDGVVYLALRAAVLAVAAEMIFRGFIMTRVAKASDSWATGNIVAALAFGVAIGGDDIGAVLGAAVAGFGYGFLFLAGNRRLAMPVGAHAAFALAAVIGAYLTI